MNLIPVQVLSAQFLPNADPRLCKALGVPDSWRCLGLIATDCDDATYIALDAATKASTVNVTYARSLYAGSSYPSSPISGEVLGILSGPTPSEVRSGMDAALDLLSSGQVGFGEQSHCLAYTVSRTGSFLAREANVPEGSPLAYLIAPPLPAISALDAALKASDVTLAKLYAPPTETNFGGGLLTGTQSACVAACEAFRLKVEEITAASHSHLI